ncbi:hypothetical protein Halru_0501 [Halovivax ruber XH-70]|uniref:Uncharacterized protein n=1 Tax=Halovivax ruber (strain DSM 18193 / JCM 13892 / XH-70) TaxID=797302 RepID=L0IA62_HALRX|nr:hypothetical protein [Halovivax ruber]AGB15136.1 hypothetical protein Halru_0501 [Halovivax ruber XH-70]
MTRIRAAVMSLLLVTSLLVMAVPGTVTAQESGNESYAGAHVDFAVDGNAITDFSVDGEQTFSDVRVQSQSDAGLGGDIDLRTMMDIDGTGLSLAAQTQTRATISAQSGAEVSAHDTQQGHLVVAAGDSSQVVEADLANDASASVEGDTVVVVDSGERDGAFIVVGDGDVAVNEDGNVAADLSSDAKLVFRSYAEGDRDEQAKAEEALIANGSAAAELAVEQRDGELVSETVTYSEETTTEVSTETANQVEVTIDRSVSEGTVVLTTVSEEAVGSVENLSVAVDGEAAAEASSMSELEAGAAGEEPRYMVTSTNEAQGEATVAVAIDHFSERTMTMSGENADDSEGDSSIPGADSLPGFGPIAALFGLLTAVGARLR